ncbi:MAG: CotH kinase family protein [Saprospiraceae bacterium]|nr:CotH kinase family protein [Lewinellaceae bacterium]
MRNCSNVVLLVNCILCLVATAGFAQSFYDKGTQEVRLKLPGSSWDSQLDSLKNVNPSARLLGTAWVNGVQFDSVGIRYKGNSSYFRTRKETTKKLPMNVKLDFRIKTQTLSDGQGTIKLSNAFLDPSFIRDPLAFSIIRRYMPAPMCNFTKLYVNDQFYGLYINTESIDEIFLEKHFKSTAGFLVKCDPDNWKRVRSQSGCPKGENASLVYLNESPGCYDAFYEVDDPASWKPLLHLIKVLNKAPEQVETVLNVDQTLWMHALNNVLVNLDSYTGSLSHNYYLWIDSTGVGHPLIWDLNMAFGGWRRDYSFNQMTDQELIEFSPFTGFNLVKRPLISNLLKKPLYRKIYVAHMKTIVREILESGLWLKEAQEMMKEIDPWVKSDPVKLYTYEDFKNSLDKTMVSGPDKIIGLRQLLDKRAAYLANHAALSKEPPVIADVKHKTANETVTITASLKNAENGWLYYRNHPMFSFKSVAMNDAGTDGDATAGDGIFSAQVPVAELAQYYVVGENADAAALFPERASKEFLEVGAKGK